MNPDLYGVFKGALERLCKAQSHVLPAHKTEMQEAINVVRRMGVFYSPPGLWSTFDEPPTPEVPA